MSSYDVVINADEIASTPLPRKMAPSAHEVRQDAVCPHQDLV
jgi:hypothetical protein